MNKNCEEGRSSDGENCLKYHMEV